MPPPPLKPVDIGITPSVVAPGKNPVFCGCIGATYPVRIGCKGASKPWFAAVGATGARGPFGLYPVACGETIEADAPVGWADCAGAGDWLAPLPTPSWASKPSL